MINTIVEIEHVKDFDEQGFYSKSYLAHDKRLDRHVAVKDIIYENLTSESDFEKYFNESLKLAIASHPRILPIYYVGLNHDGSDEKIPRIVTHYYKNGSLNSYLEHIYKDNRTLNLDDVIRFAHDIIQGMIHLHVLDIVHLDLKAANIYITDDFKLVIGDFGQARFIKDGIIHDLRDIYPAINPIESFTKGAVDKTADIYQFGMLLYSMLCYNVYRSEIENTYKISTSHLKKLFRDNPLNKAELKVEFNSNCKLFKNAIRDKVFPSRTDYPYYVPDKIKEIIHKCLAPVADRYNNFYQIQTELNEFIFPKGVTELHQDLNTNMVHFVKDEKPCVIEVTSTGSKFDIRSTKNDRNVKDCTKTDITSVKLNKILFTLMSEI